SRGWTILTWDVRQKKLRIFNGDVHNQGGVWGALPVLALDVYEHAYFIDYGSDRKSYIESYFKNLNWKFAQDAFESYTK
ncbi:MAG: Fe-Mn family superoxide dismutase, partial [Patescibacteria group bacterium]